MDKEFADWYQSAEITPSSDLLSKRWEGIDKFVSTANAAALLDAIRLFYGLRSKDPQFLARFQEAFKLADVSFPMRGNDHELKILAGSSAVAALSKEKIPLANVAALAMVCGDYRGRRRGERPADLVGRARRYLLERSAGLRKASETVAVAVPKLPSIKHQEGSPDLNATSQGLAALAGAMKTFVDSTTKVLQQLHERVVLQGEESDILWWVFAGYSRDLERPISDLHPAAACLIAAKELADLTAILPGPASAPAILDRVLHGAVGSRPKKVVTLSKAIQEAPVAWLKGWASGDELISAHGDLCPTLLAAQRSLETPGSDAWVVAVEQITGVSVREKLSAVSLAAQAYDEHRLVRAIESAR